MGRKPLKAVTGLLLVAGTAASASAELICDTFWIELTHDNQLIDGGGSGHNDAQWYYYPGPTWGRWDQWFYDHPPDPNRWKEITYDIEFWTDIGTEGLEININCSTLDYGPNPDEPPLPPQEQYILGFHIADTLASQEPQRITGSFPIESYNPEWVSIEVSAYPYNHVGTIHVEGTICHECIPEPATSLLLTLGVLGVRRRTRACRSYQGR